MQITLTFDYHDHPNEAIDQRFRDLATGLGLTEALSDFNGGNVHRRLVFSGEMSEASEEDPDASGE